MKTRSLPGMTRFVAITVLLFVTAPVTCQTAGRPITIKGSTTVLPLVQVAAETFMETNPGVTISVQGGGSGVGIASLLDRTTDIATSSRRIKDEEVKKAKASRVNPHETAIALDGIAVIVHPSNPVRGLSKAQIKDIYTGRISSWSEVGGRKAKIVTVNRDTSSGTFEAFDALALDKKKVRRDALTSASNQAVAQTVAQTPGAVGYVGIGYLTPRVRPVPVDGIACSRKTVQSGEYPLSRSLYLYTNGKPLGAAGKFIAFVLSPEGQKLVEAEGFISIRK